MPVQSNCSAHCGQPGIKAASKIQLMTSKSPQYCSLPLAQDRVKRQRVCDCSVCLDPLRQYKTSKEAVYMSQNESNNIAKL